MGTGIYAIIIGNMFHPYWFGVKLEYVCSLCCITSVEMHLVNSTTDDLGKIRARIEQESLSCQHCGAPLGRGTEVDLGLLAGTLEYLQSVGFQIPDKPSN
jgi:hypothetical protein